VVLFSDETPIRLIETILPDVLVKGGDYTPETVVGADLVKRAGGRVELIPLIEGLSTTNTIRKMQSRAAEEKQEKTPGPVPTASPPGADRLPSVPPIGKARAQSTLGDGSSKVEHK
jgi:ERCC4-type nuclease